MEPTIPDTVEGRILADLRDFYKVKDPESGDWLGVPPSVATLDQIDIEVSRLEQKHAVTGRIVGGYRATVERLRELGVAGDATGAEIGAQFAPELEA